MGRNIRLKKETIIKISAIVAACAVIALGMICCIKLNEAQKLHAQEAQAAKLTASMRASEKIAKLMEKRTEAATQKQAQETAKTVSEIAETEITEISEAKAAEEVPETEYVEYYEEAYYEPEEEYYYTSGSGYTPGDLMYNGVIYDNGIRYTWYSENVLPGGGLDIPGRWSDGNFVRDANGYICCASEDLPWGTVVETPWGTACVYDCGCASGTIDMYTSW